MWGGGVVLALLLCTTMKYKYIYICKYTYLHMCLCFIVVHSSRAKTRPPPQKKKKKNNVCSADIGLQGKATVIMKIIRLSEGLDKRKSYGVRLTTAYVTSPFSRKLLFDYKSTN